EGTDSAPVERELECRVVPRTGLRDSILGKVDDAAQIGTPAQEPPRCGVRSGEARDLGRAGPPAPWYTYVKLGRPGHHRPGPHGVFRNPGVFRPFPPEIPDFPGTDPTPRARAVPRCRATRQESAARPRSPRRTRRTWPQPGAARAAPAPPAGARDRSSARSP